MLTQKQFYKTRAWRQARRAYIEYRMAIDGGLCEVCHEEPGLIVHHKIWLDDTNCNDPDISLNLQAGGNHIVWFGLTWSLELYQQANARIYRQGVKGERIPSSSSFSIPEYVDSFVLRKYGLVARRTSIRLITGRPWFDSGTVHHAAVVQW